MRNFFLLILIIFTLTASIATTQEIKAEKQIIQKTFEDLQPVDQELRRKILFARKLISDRNYDGAASLLEVIYETEQNNQTVINLLRQCYLQLKQNFKLEEIIKKQIETDSSNLGYYLSLAEVVVQQGRINEARLHYKKSISLIEGINRVRFQLVIQSMMNNSLESDAEKQIIVWRKESLDNTLLGEQLGLIYARKKEYKKALAEYYPLLLDTTQVGNGVEKEIVELLLFEDSAPIAEEYLVEQNKKLINKRAVNILSMHYIRSGQLDKSFAYTKLRDSLYEKNGNILISYMQTCKREKLYDEMIRMGNYLLGQYEQPALQNRAKFFIADAYTNLGQYQKSIQTYSEIFESTVAGREKADALYYIAKIYQNNLNDIDLALLYFDSLTTNYKTGLNYMNALIDIPYCYMQKGELKKAKELFLTFDAQRLQTDLQEKVNFQLAQVLFLEHNNDSCKTILSKLLIDYPMGFYVNDALTLMRIIQSGEENSNILDMYASAMLYDIQRNEDSVIAMYKNIIEDDSKILADLAIYKLIGIFVEQNNNVDAIEFIDKMEASFVESYYFPFALKQKADILFLQNKNADEAVSIYHHLLVDFPNYPFIREVREILRIVSEEKPVETS